MLRSGGAHASNPMAVAMASGVTVKMPLATTITSVPRSIELFGSRGSSSLRPGPSPGTPGLSRGAQAYPMTAAHVPILPATLPLRCESIAAGTPSDVEALLMVHRDQCLQGAHCIQSRLQLRRDARDALWSCEETLEEGAELNAKLSVAFKSDLQISRVAIELTTRRKKQVFISRRVEPVFSIDEGAEACHAGAASGSIALFLGVSALPPSSTDSEPNSQAIEILASARIIPA